MQNLSQIKKENVEKIDEYFSNLSIRDDEHKHRRSVQINNAKHRTRAEKKAHKEKHEKICNELSGGKEL